jgi:hypothetical protein
MLRWPSTTPGRVSTSTSFIAVALDLREVADLRLRKADVLQRLRGQAGDAGVDLGLAEAQALRRPLVEPGAVLAHRRVATALDVGEDAFDGGAHLGVEVGLGGGRLAGLDDLHGHGECLRSQGMDGMLGSAPATGKSFVRMRRIVGGHT